ncbi:MAG TPA: DMT family transporter [Termitinemataceae bacterium]|nr:DMT family transporter [Termitinemataceae bacterium]HPQ01573.1 DMT family transporter [Termitinemataceae bacterium]
MNAHLGELAGLATSICWTITALAFERAAKRIGSLALNILRLVVALFLFMVFRLVVAGEALPLHAPQSVWFWLSLSGLVGFTFGDIFLFQSYIDIGARTAQVVFISYPLITTLLSFFILRESISPRGLLGMVLVIGAILWVVLEKKRLAGKELMLQGTGDAHPATTQNSKDSSGITEPPHQSKKGALRIRGFLFAFLAALGQAGGLVLSKIGAPSFDPFAATQIRVIAGLAGFLLVALMGRQVNTVVAATGNRAALLSLSIGAFFGPFLGVSLGLVAVQHTATGVAATLMGLTPILIIFPSVLINKEKIHVVEVLGAALAVAGSVLIFLR